MIRVWWHGFDRDHENICWDNVLRPETPHLEYIGASLIGMSRPTMSHSNNNLPRQIQSPGGWPIVSSAQTSAHKVWNISFNDNLTMLPLHCGRGNAIYGTQVDVDCVTVFYILWAQLSEKFIAPDRPTQWNLEWNNNECFLVYSLKSGLSLLRGVNTILNNIKQKKPLLHRLVSIISSCNNKIKMKTISNNKSALQLIYFNHKK